MWQIDNRTPFAAERGWVRDRDGAEVWLVVVKATFDILADGSTVVAAAQPPPTRSPEHYAEPSKSSVKFDTDLVLTKQTTDVIVVGHAYAPPGTTVRELDVGLRVGPIQKKLRVFGDRRWGVASPSAPEPFRRLPLIYERAYGGGAEGQADTRNPVGAGGDPAGAVLPNIEDPRRLIDSRSDKPAPAGFGAIASHWQPRAALAGTYDEGWLRTRQPLLAADLDDRYFQAAPADQQTPQFLHGGEPVVLDHLTADVEQLRFLLPRIHLGFETRFLGGESVIHTTRALHSVILEPDFPRLSLVWHSSLRCHPKVYKLERTVVTAKRGLKAGAPVGHEETESA